LLRFDLVTKNQCVKAKQVHLPNVPAAHRKNFFNSVARPVLAWLELLPIRSVTLRLRTSRSRHRAHGQFRGGRFGASFVVDGLLSAALA